METDMMHQAISGNSAIESEEGMPKVRVWRRRRGMSQVELSEATGLAQSTISHLESGASKAPRPRTLYKIAQVLDVDPLELLDGPL